MMMMPEPDTPEGIVNDPAATVIPANKVEPPT